MLKRLGKKRGAARECFVVGKALTATYIGNWKYAKQNMSEEEVPYTVNYLDGEQEEVTWIERAGKARVQYQNGDVYEGTYNDSKQKHGFGKYTFKQPAVEDEVPPEVSYEGDYVNGLRQGVGVMKFPDSGRYHGQFSEGERHGQGSYMYPNGDVYSGEWVQGRKEGPGTYLFKESDSSFRGIWKNGDIISGDWVHKDGTTWNGTFANGRPCGYGSFTFKNGNVQTGEYIEQKNDADPEDEFATIPVWIGERVSRQLKK